MLVKLTDKDGDATLINIEQITVVAECYKVEDGNRFRTNTRFVHLPDGRMEVKETVEQIQELCNSLEMLCYGKEHD